MIASSAQLRRRLLPALLALAGLLGTGSGTGSGWGADWARADSGVSGMPSMAGMPGGPAGPEYIHQLPPTLRNDELRVERAGLDLFVSVGRSREAYFVSVRIPTGLSAGELESPGGYAVSLFTSVLTRDGQRAKTLALLLPADWPLGRTLSLPGGLTAVRHLDERLGTLVVELALPEGSVGLDADGRPEIRLEVVNANAARGNRNVGRQLYPPDGDRELDRLGVDRLGLGRLPADPARAAASELLGEFDAAVHICSDADGRDLDNLLMRAALTRFHISTGQLTAARAELDDLLDRLDWLADEKRLDGQDAVGLRERVLALRRVLASMLISSLVSAAREADGATGTELPAAVPVELVAPTPRPDRRR